MSQHLVTVLCVLAAIEPTLQVSPSPFPSASPKSALRVIGHVRVTTPLCKSALLHADTGIAILVRNDARVAASTNELRRADFDKNVLTEQNALSDLRAQSVAISKEASEGNATMKLLKDEAVTARTPEQREALLLFQEALDGALMRQKRLGDRLGRMLVYIDNHPRIDADTRAQLDTAAVIQQSYLGAYQDPKGPLHQVPDSLDTIAGTVATELDIREQAVQTDEGTAADRIDDAFAKC